ncbi:MAG: hypothetical protein J6V44_03490 [Methanobrevibacter sp.]|nr:hypothetical protein [Methanobrevibacter sp.]
MKDNFNPKIFEGYNIVCNDSYVPYDMPFIIWEDTIYVRKELYEELKKLPKKKGCI